MSTISLRIHTALWREPALYRPLLDLLADYRDTVTEVAFFTGSTHPPLPLATVLEEAEQLGREAIPAARALGLRAGINHLATLGHLDENPAGSLNEPWQHLVDISGAVSPSCYCVSDPRVMDYTRQCYAAFAAADPAFIWIDDDVRLEHHPRAVTMACFCPYCLERFSATSGRDWTREALREALSTAGTRGDRLALRRQWQAHLRDYVTGLLHEIRSAVDGVNPTIELGFMSGETAYTGYGYEERVAAMEGENTLTVHWRPGGGFYHDDRPLDALLKAHAIGRQIAGLPTGVADVQYEHENFPYQRIRKSNALFLGEIAAALGAGCTGVALNCISMYDPTEEYRPLFEAVRGAAEFIRTAGDTCGRSACAGLWVPFGPEHFSACNPDSPWEQAWGWSADLNLTHALFEIGLPPAYHADGAAITIMTPETCVEYSEEDLRTILAGAVLLDGPTLERLHEIGLGELTGFTPAGRMDLNSRERFTAHALNSRFAGWHRDCRPSFYPVPVHLISPLPGAEVLAEAVDFQNQAHGACMGIFENSLGGRVAVQGYYPYTMVENLAKTEQLKAVCRWLTRDTLPGYIASYHRAALWSRRDAQGNPVTLVLNANLDTVDDLRLALSTPAATALTMDGRTHTLTPEPAGVYTHYRLPALGPWQAALIQS
jgi:hypothetical protein